MLDFNRIAHIVSGSPWVTMAEHLGAGLSACQHAQQAVPQSVGILPAAIELLFNA